jgi:alpha-ribazole phosphatase
MRKLIVVRHGRTAWNLGRRFQGHSDIPLDEEGRAQARVLAETLREEQVDFAVCSDLSRARETGEIILAGREIPLSCDAGWREMRFGAWEGLTWGEIVAAYPALAQAETQCERHAPEGGETFEALCARIGAAFERLRAVVPAQGCGLVVTHAGPLHALLRVLKAMSEEESLAVRFAPASATSFLCRGDAWSWEYSP